MASLIRPISFWARLLGPSAFAHVCGGQTCTDAGKHETHGGPKHGRSHMFGHTHLDLASNSFHGPGCLEVTASHGATPWPNKKYLGWPVNRHRISGWCWEAHMLLKGRAVRLFWTRFNVLYSTCLTMLAVQATASLLRLVSPTRSNKKCDS